jgi:hypothetical protein
MRRQPLLMRAVGDAVFLAGELDRAFRVGRFDGADLDRLGLDAGDTSARQLALRWLGAGTRDMPFR